MDGRIATIVAPWPISLYSTRAAVRTLSYPFLLSMERERHTMIRSMTGFGRGQAPWQDGSVTVEVRSVNHRFLEVACRLPRSLAFTGLL